MNLNKTKLFSLIIYCAYINLTIAQQPLQITNDQKEVVIPYQHLWVYEDSTQMLGLEQVLKLQSSFNPCLKLNSKTQSNKINYWIHFTISGETLQKNQWYLEFPIWDIEEIEFYEKLNGNNFKKINTGSTRPSQNRQYQHKNYIAEISSDQAMVHFYVKLKSNEVNPFLFQLKRDTLALSYALQEYILLGMFYGILFLIILYNFIKFIISKNSLNLSYVGYALSCALLCTSIDGLGFQYIWPNMPFINKYLIASAPYLFMLFLTLYANSFLEISKTQKTVFRLTVLSVIVSFVFAYVKQFTFPANNIHYTFLIPFFLILYACIKYNKSEKSNIGSKIFLLGFSLNLVGILIMYLRNTNLINWLQINTPLKILLVYYLNFSLLLEVILFSIAQTLKIRSNQEKQVKISNTNKERFKSIFESAFDAIIVYDTTQNKIIDVNKSAIQLFGFNKRDFLLVPLDQVIQLEDHNKLKNKSNFSTLLEESFSSGKRTYSQLQGINSYRDTICFSLSFSSLKDFNENIQVLTIKDITQTKQMEKNLEDKIIEITNKNKKLEQYINSNSELESFAYTASHDMKQPIRSIKSFSQLLKRHLDQKGMSDDTTEEFLNFIIDGSFNLEQLIHGLLRHSQVNSIGDIKFSPVNIEAILVSVKLNLTQLINENNVEIKYSELPTLAVEQTRITQLFQNLISNAIKFRKKDHPCTIEISAVEKENQWEFIVKDNGIGINKEHHDKIFQLFTKLHNSTDYKGSGIGLATCKRIIEQHNGQISVESTLGEGTSFIFSIDKNLISDAQQENNIMAEAFN